MEEGPLMLAGEDLALVGAVLRGVACGLGQAFRSLEMDAALGRQVSNGAFWNLVPGVVGKRWGRQILNVAFWAVPLLRKEPGRASNQVA